MSSMITPENDQNWENKIVQTFFFSKLHENHDKSKWKVFFKEVGLSNDPHDHNKSLGPLGFCHKGESHEHHDHSSK